MNASIRETLVAVSATLTNPDFKSKLETFTVRCSLYARSRFF
jgi:hypothetical protein